MRHTPLILAVDDDPDIRLGLQLRLHSAGFDCLLCVDGQDGLQTAIDCRPDAIIADIRMPGLDGLSMLDKLQKRNDTASIPVLIVSANTADKAKMEAKQLGAYCFLEKPYAVATLIQALNSALGLQGSHP